MGRLRDEIERSEPSRGVPTFSEQQLAVLDRLAHGFSHAQVAHTMHLSLATVSYHVERLKQITGQKTVPAVVAFAFVNHIFDVDEWATFSGL